jgi:hypothetical protein
MNNVSICDKLCGKITFVANLHDALITSAELADIRFLLLVNRNINSHERPVGRRVFSRDTTQLLATDNTESSEYRSLTALTARCISESDVPKKTSDGIRLRADNFVTMGIHIPNS